MAYNWKKAEAWRKHPLMTNNMRYSFPGLGIALIAFGAYVAYDQTIGGGKKGHH